MRKPTTEQVQTWADVLAVVAIVVMWVVAPWSGPAKIMATLLGFALAGIAHDAAGVLLPARADHELNPDR